jgi:hypothetical protein
MENENLQDIQKTNKTFRKYDTGLNIAYREYTLPYVVLKKALKSEGTFCGGSHNQVTARVGDISLHAKEEAPYHMLQLEQHIFLKICRYKRPDLRQLALQVAELNPCLYRFNNDEEMAK